VVEIGSIEKYRGARATSKALAFGVLGVAAGHGQRLPKAAFTTKASGRG